MTTKPAKYKMLPYRRQGEIDYAALDFNPDVSVEKPEAMEQHRNNGKSSDSLLPISLTSTSGLTSLSIMTRTFAMTAAT